MSTIELWTRTALTESQRFLLETASVSKTSKLPDSASNHIREKRFETLVNNDLLASAFE